MSVVQSVILVFVCAAGGSILAQRIGFRSVVNEMWLTNTDLRTVLRRQFRYSVPIGAFGALLAYLVAPEFIGYLDSFPQLTRLFGGLYEEIVTRWGIMTFIVWALWRIDQKGIGIPRVAFIWSGIVLSQILFACGHIANLLRCGIADPHWPVLTIFVASLPWGWLFWKRGIESAIIAHVSFHAFAILLVAVKI
jgi:hypothetical protein